LGIKGTNFPQAASPFYRPTNSIKIQQEHLTQVVVTKNPVLGIRKADLY